MNALGHHDGVFAVGSVIHVVRIFNAYGLYLLASRGIDFSQAIAKIVQCPERLQIIRRSDVLRLAPDFEVVDDLEGSEDERVYGVAAAIRDINKVGEAPHRRGKIPGPSLRINIVGIDHPRHAGEQADLGVSRSLDCEPSNEREKHRQSMPDSPSD